MLKVELGNGEAKAPVQTVWLQKLLAEPPAITRTVVWGPRMNQT